MITTIKKHIVLLALVAGSIAPVTAMETNEGSSGLFGWKTAAAVAVVGAGTLYWFFSDTDSYKTKPLPPTPEEKNGQTPVVVGQRSTQRSVQPVAVPAEPKPLCESDEVVCFTKANATLQKTELAKEITAYVEHPSQKLADLITQYANVYCMRVKSEKLTIAVNKLFAAKNKQARQEQAIAIKKLLGLVYY